MKPAVGRPGAPAIRRCARPVARAAPASVDVRRQAHRVPLREQQDATQARTTERVEDEGMASYGAASRSDCSDHRSVVASMRCVSVSSWLSQRASCAIRTRVSGTRNMRCDSRSERICWSGAVCTVPVKHVSSGAGRRRSAAWLSAHATNSVCPGAGAGAGGGCAGLAQPVSNAQPGLATAGTGALGDRGRNRAP
jgi:hypothetical protein